MSLTLGEKLRQAREDRGFTISEVSEQTRISPLYLESIENDDYGNLPGGIFNKGFVKSYAKFVGLNEQEALLDYTRLISAVEGEDDGALRKYRPEVLTDDGGGRSMVPTVIVAVLILGAMTAAILFGVNYLRRQRDTPAVSQPSNLNTTSNSNTTTDSNKETEPSAVPDMETLKVEFRALGQPVSLTATNDGKTNTSVVAPGAAATFEPKTSLKLSYSRSLANFVQLTINGKQISLPAVPLEPKRSVIEFEINKANLAQIWTSGAVSAEVPPASAEPGAAPANAARTTTAPRSTPAVANTAAQTFSITQDDA
jgi:cytoskeletal protein RodZ